MEAGKDVVDMKVPCHLKKPKFDRPGDKSGTPIHRLLLVDASVRGQIWLVVCMLMP